MINYLFLIYFTTYIKGLRVKNYYEVHYLSTNFFIIKYINIDI